LIGIDHVSGDAGNTRQLDHDRGPWQSEIIATQFGGTIASGGAKAMAPRKGAAPADVMVAANTAPRHIERKAGADKSAP
jgi:hypothetical protein